MTDNVRSRRDGTPFLNLVMMAPLMDHHGTVKYFIGCQVDISHLMEAGRGLESFRQLLQSDEQRLYKPLPNSLTRKPTLKALRDLSHLLNDEEMNVVKQEKTDRRISIESTGSTPAHAVHTPSTRRVIGMDEPVESTYLPPSQFGSSGRLPGVYQNVSLARIHSCIGACANPSASIYSSDPIPPSVSSSLPPHSESQASLNPDSWIALAGRHTCEKDFWTLSPKVSASRPKSPGSLNRQTAPTRRQTRLQTRNLKVQTV